MKKLLFTSLLSLIGLFVSAQDEHKSVELKEGQKDPVEEEFNCCKLYIYASPARNNSECSVTIEVENNYTHDIFLFGRAYEEKALKKQKPSIRFHKNSGGIKNIISCAGCRGDEILRIEPGRKRSLNFENANHSKLELPMYIAKHQQKKFLSSEKYIILQRSIITLDIEIISGSSSDENYEELKTKYEELMDELNEMPFCPRSNHGISLKKQQEPYATKIKDILDEISTIKKENKWRDSSEGYQKYKELKKMLEDINFKDYEKWCGECRSSSGSSTPRRSHQCSYCDKSLNDVLNSLQRIYIRLDTGTPKSSVMEEVNALHNAWTRGCPNLSKKKREDTSGKSSQIDNYYDRIVRK